MKKLGNYLLAKDTHAIIAAFVCALLPLFYLPTGFLAAIIVALVTLQKGPKSGAVVLAWVALPAVASLVLRSFGAFDILLLRCFVIWGLAALLRQYRSWGLILEAAASVGILVIIGMHFIVPDMHQWWITHLTGYMNEIAKASEWKFSITPAELVRQIAPIATGVVSFFFLCGVILELIIAQYWRSQITDSAIFSGEFLQLRIGQFLAGVSAILLILALFKMPVMIDILPLVFLPFFLAGLSLMHYVARLKKPFFGAMILIYIGLIFLPIFVVSTLAAVGFMDSWTDFRKKVIKK